VFVHSSGDDVHLFGFTPCGWKDDLQGIWKEQIRDTKENDGRENPIPIPKSKITLYHA
jgi:hypothetical protein